MDLLLHLLSALLLGCGCLLGITGGIGIYRLPDFYTRLHATSVTDTLCAFCILSGLGLQAGFSQVSAKLALIFLFLLVTSPTASHALARAALLQQEPMVIGDDEGETRHDNCFN